MSEYLDDLKAISKKFHDMGIMEVPTIPPITCEFCGFMCYHHPHDNHYTVCDHVWDALKEAAEPGEGQIDPLSIKIVKAPAWCGRDITSGDHLGP